MRRPGGVSRGSQASFAALALGVAFAVAERAPAHAETFFFRDRSGVTHFTNVPTDRRYEVLRTARSTFSQVIYKPGATAAVRGRGDGVISYGPSSFRPMRWIEPPEELAALITTAAKRHRVEPALVHAVVRAESAFDHLAVSRAGAMGLMQLMPDTASLVGVRDAFHPRENVEGGVYYLRKMLDRFDNNVTLALAAYNAGPAAVEDHGGVPPYAETQEYLERVFRYRQEYLRRSIERGRLALVTRQVR